MGILDLSDIDFVSRNVDMSWYCRVIIQVKVMESY